MIRGFFVPHPLGNAPLPVFAAHVLLPRFGSRELVLFLADTGSDVTIVNPQDAERLVPPGIALNHALGIAGIGGTVGRYAEETGELTFREDDGAVTIPLTVHLAPHGHGNPVLPSLLGRDVLSRFRFVMDQRVNELLLI